MPALLVSFLFWLMRTTREEWLAKRAGRADSRPSPSDVPQQSPA